jgi:hypothetical protein
LNLLRRIHRLSIFGGQNPMVVRHERSHWKKRSKQIMTLQFEMQ